MSPRKLPSSVTVQPATGPHSQSPSRPAWQSRLVGFGLLLSALSGLGMVTLVSAQEPQPMGAVPYAAEGGLPGQPPAPHAHHMPMGGMQFEQVLTEIHASPEQRQQLKQIFQAARDDLKSQHEGALAEHRQMLQLLAQATIDAQAVEAVRKQEVARHDAQSKRMTQAMLAASQVLSFEQRQQWVASMSRHAGPMMPNGPRG